VKQVGNTILTKRGNHIVAKGDNPAYPKGAKSRGFSNQRQVATCRALQMAAWKPFAFRPVQRCGDKTKDKPFELSGEVWGYNAREAMKQNVQTIKKQRLITLWKAI